MTEIGIDKERARQIESDSETGSAYRLLVAVGEVGALMR